MASLSFEKRALRGQRRGSPRTHRDEGPIFGRRVKESYSNGHTNGGRRGRGPPAETANRFATTAKATVTDAWRGRVLTTRALSPGFAHLFGMAYETRPPLIHRGLTLIEQYGYWAVFAGVFGEDFGLLLHRGRR
jgi:hypothetical protein